MPRPKPKSHEELSPSDFHFAVIKRDHWCQKCFHKEATDAHHVIRKSQGGKYLRVNGLGLCHQCHMALHNGQWRLIISDLPKECIRYLEEKGQLWRYGVKYREDADRMTESVMKDYYGPRSLEEGVFEVEAVIKIENDSLTYTWIFNIEKDAETLAKFFRKRLPEFESLTVKNTAA